jgi:hypothetical protein
MSNRGRTFEDTAVRFGHVWDSLGSRIHTLGHVNGHGDRGDDSYIPVALETYGVAPGLVAP